MWEDGSPWEWDKKNSTYWNIGNKSLVVLFCLFTFSMDVCLLLGEPNNSTAREDCIEAGGDGYWNDIDCNIKFREQWHGKLYYLCNKL